MTRALTTSAERLAALLVAFYTKSREHSKETDPTERDLLHVEVDDILDQYSEAKRQDQ